VARRRQAVEEEREQQARLRRERAQAQTVLTDLTAFCARVRGRLADATFEDRQAILQLLIERVIVHDDRLEVRHVIPLRSAPEGAAPHGDPPARLRSDGVDLAALPARPLEVAADRRPHAGVVVAGDQHHPAQSPRLERPEHLLGRADYLVTRDKDLLALAAEPLPLRIVSPGVFLRDLGLV
jgi:hypothetical protein